MSALRMAQAHEVWELLGREVRPLAAQRVDVVDALRRTLARDALAELDYPPFDRALMDGFAVCAADFHAGRATLALHLGVERAGASALAAVAPGTCVQINTGARIPPGADAVVAVERVESQSAERVTLVDATRVGQNIERRAAHLSRGQALLRAGTSITPAALAALVAADIRAVETHAVPRVAILTTGDELTPLDQALQAGQIRDSNGVLLRELVEQAGGTPQLLGRAADEPIALTALLTRGLSAADLLCVAGGMSKGTHDLVPRALGELGVRWLVESLDLKPGKPTRIGRAPSGAWVIGLPGNPVSCAVCFLLFGRMIVEGLCGKTPVAPSFLRARLDSDLPANGERPMFHPAQWYVTSDGVANVTPLTWRGSGDPFGLAHANALLHRMARAERVTRGDHADIVPLDRPR